MSDVKNLHPFATEAARILNSNESHSLLLTGNIYDLFSCRNEYLPLVEFLSNRWSVEDSGIIVVVYELNSPIRFINPADRDKVKTAWMKWKGHEVLDEDDIAIRRMLEKNEKVDQVKKVNNSFDQNLLMAIDSPTFALEWLRQLCCLSRTIVDGKALLAGKLLIIIEGADKVLPESGPHNLSDAIYRRISIFHDWFSDSGFLQGKDSVVLLAESRSMINSHVSKLPMISEVPIPLPGPINRTHFLNWFRENDPHGKDLSLWDGDEELVKISACLSIHSMRQLFINASYRGVTLTAANVVAKVEEYIKSQLGEEVAGFKKPSHKLKDLVGFANLIHFLRSEVIPRMLSTGDDALPGAAVAGPLGSGKTFIFEAVAAELGIPVLVIKGIRSMWYGQTDVIFERLMRVITALDRVLIFVDEADTQFGSVSSESHSTERRLTGKVQSMMSDASLLGKVTWLLMTARIDQLSPDIRRPGRAGDLIIPVLDPEDDDLVSFVIWTTDCVSDMDNEKMEELCEQTKGWSAASFASLRRELKAKAKTAELTFEDVKVIIDDRIPPSIETERSIQTLQALINCTRKSLLPESDKSISERRKKWEAEVVDLKRKLIFA